MSRIHDLITACLAAEVASRTGWDEAPGLYFLYLEGGRPRLSQLPVPDAVWAQDRPPYVLAAMADVSGEYSGLLRAVAPEGLHGAAFRCETWVVAEPPPGTAERSELHADAMAHRLHQRADRREARSMWAVDRAGITYGAVLRRGIDAEPRTQVSYPGAARRLSGTIPEALQRLVTAVLGVHMGGYP